MKMSHSENRASVDELKQAMRDYRRIVDAELERVLPPADRPPAEIHRAMRHSMFSGGKRLRPMLVLMGCELCGGNQADAMPAACAFEMIHTYSLIHDDLPAMDNDDFRRGHPTCHKAFGEAMAILAGDALLTQAFELLASHLRGRGELIAEIAAAAGTAGMIGGQVADILSEGTQPDAALVEFIHKCKTAALIRQAVRTGAAIAGADAAALDAVTQYAEKIGLAFQVADDILDVEGTTEQLGKTAGKDRQAGKQTYPAVYGLPESRRHAAKLVSQAVQCLEPFGQKARMLASLADFIVTRTS